MFKELGFYKDRIKHLEGELQRQQHSNIKIISANSDLKSKLRDFKSKKQSNVEIETEVPPDDLLDDKPAIRQTHQG